MKSCKGTWRLLRLAMRRDRIVLPVTMLIALAMVVASAPALISTYATQEQILSYIIPSAPSVVGRVFQGTIQGPTIGSIVMAEVFLTAAIILGIMSVFIISRHTRHNEETGAGELIGSGVVGRNAPLTAAMSLALLANIVTGLLIFGSLATMPELNITGSAYMALSLTMFGVLMAGVSAVAVQFSDYRRGANLMSIAVLGAFFIIRALGDALGKLSADGLSVTASWFSWLSPMGWSFQVLPYSSNRLFPIFMMLGLFIVLIAGAYYLMNKRDEGSSIIESKSGLARAKHSLLGAGGLASRLQKGSLIAWTTGFVATGVLVAVMVDDFKKTFQENELYADWVANSGAQGVSFMESIVSIMFMMMAALLAGYVVTAISKMQDEESSGRIEYLLGTALGRIKWLFSHVFFTLRGALIAIGAMGLAGGISYALTSSSGEVSIIDIFASAIVNFPAMMLFASVIVLVFALLGRFVKTFAWSFYAYCGLIGSFAGIFGWPKWVTYLSPFNHTPSYPTASFDWLPIIVMTVSSVAVLGMSAYFFTRRDISLS